MKYVRYMGYSVLLGTAMMAAAGMDIMADENDQTPIPVEELSIPQQETVTEETPTFQEETEKEETIVEIEETETSSEPVLAADAAKNEVNNGIPVIYLNIDESKGTIEAMNSDPKHKTFCYGTLDFKLPSSDFKYADLNTELKEYSNLDMQIRGRGNSTWTADKKPYKIKLDKKTDLLGQGKDEKNKHWVLIANMLDPTLVKDRLTGYIGDKIGLEYTPIGVPVDVVMNDTYLGSYLLMENVRVGTGRIDIEELNEGDVDPLTITGGYLVQDGTQVAEGAPSLFYTNHELTWNNKTPSFNPNDDGYVNEAQKNYIRNYMQMIEDILYSDTQTDANGNPYSYYMDLPSAAKYWLVQALSKNTDAYRTGSTYLYKKRDTQSGNGKLYWGPLWDFDLGWGVFDMPAELPAEGFSDYVRGWIIPMIHDTDDGSFYSQIQKEWPALKNMMLDIIKDGGLIDQYYQETKASKEQDLKKFPAKIQTDYQTHMNNLKTWIQKRVTWMDENLASVNEFSRKVKIQEDGQPDIVYYLKDGSELSELKTPARDGFVFQGWMKEDGSIVPSKTSVTSDMILSPKWLSIADASKYEEVIFRQDIVSLPFKKGDTFSSYFTAYPANAEYKKIQWESSDPAVATVDESGKITHNQVGTTTITAILADGSRWSYILNLLEKPVTPQDVTVTENMTIKPGEHRHIDVITSPSNACIDTLLFNLKDTNILGLDYLSGTVTGRTLGTTTVTVYVWYTEPESGKRLTWEKVCTITVVEEVQPDETPSEPIPSQEQTDIKEEITVIRNQPKGVPTALSTNTGLWLGSMTLAALGMALSTYRRFSKN